MSKPASRAVFVSYTREDVATAQRIAEALRTHGVEVWFDQSELRGGDTWDQKIKKQIRECALFLAVVSAHTQARGEGYFRREWKLAVERTHDLAEGVPFLLPVVIDDTPEAGAAVPEAFMHVQWTRLPGALPSPQFVEQVRCLLAAPGRPTGSGTASRSAERGETPTRSATIKRVPAAVAWLAAIAVVAGGAAGWQWLRHPATAIKPGPVVSDKSVAVLPFTSLSADKENEYFADGIHEDVLTNLQNIRELRVVSRQSVIGYRGTTKKMPEIARELGVAYLLEGSVRRAGGKVLVTGQLIRAATDEHLWAANYTKDLTAADVFAIQADLAQKIATALHAALSPQERNRVALRPTENLAAYELYLKSRVRGPSTPADYQARESLLQSAVALDPKFAAAWSALARVHVEYLVAPFDTTPARRAKAKAAMDRALELAPDSYEVMRNLGFYYTFGLKDNVRASEVFEKLVQLQPNDAGSRGSLGMVQMFQGHWPEVIASSRMAARLEPGGAGYAVSLVNRFRLVRRFDDAIAEQRRLIALRPGRPEDEAMLARLAFLATGSTRETDELLARLEAREPKSPEAVEMRKEQALRREDYPEFFRLDRLHPTVPNVVTPYDAEVVRAIFAARIYRSKGDIEGARARLENIPSNLQAELQLQPDHTWFLGAAAMVEAILGHRDEALRRIAQAVEIEPESKNAFVGVSISVTRAQVLMWTGDTERALAEFTRLLRKPSELNIHEMKANLALYAPLRGDPRFMALLNDPKNNEPLF